MKQLVTMADVVAAKSEMIFYSSGTIWWTHDPEDFCKPTPEHLERMGKLFGKDAVEAFTQNPIPLDPFNSPLYQTENVTAWLDTNSINKHEAYGPKVEQRVEIFMWSHAQNMKLLLEDIKKGNQEGIKYAESFEAYRKLLDSKIYK